MSSPKKLLISIVTPCYQEEANVRDHLRRVQTSLDSFGEKYDFEYIYTDNCSTDRTFDVLSQMATEDPRVKILRFSRNVGANRAVYQGLTHAKGDAVMLIQADLQDPPELIPEFVKAWENGFDVAYGQILDREESWFMKKVRRLYYQLVSTVAEVPPPRNAGDFRIVSKRVIDAIKLYSEDDMYLRGVIAHIGFRQKPIPYKRAARAKGTTSTNLLYLLGFTLNAITSTSVVPLRTVTIVGLFVAFIGFLFGIVTVLNKLISPEFIPHGITTLAILITFFAGVQILTLGIIGEYIRRIFMQSLGRPQAIIMDKVNFEV